jgi:hypothetical protein
MGIFKSIGLTIDNLRSVAEAYIETQLKLLKLQAAEKASTLFSTLAAYLVLVFFLLFFLLFASIAGAYALSDLLGRPYAGFLIVSGIYLLVGFFIFLNRERLLKKPMLNAITRQLFRDSGEPDNFNRQSNKN